MADDDEENVVFANSALYQHLRDVGYSEEEVGAEDVSFMEELTSSASKPHDKIPEERKTSQGFISWWKQKKLCIEKVYGKEIVDAVVSSGVLEEDDKIFLHNYASVCADNNEDDLTSYQHHSTSLFQKPAGLLMIACVVIIGYAIRRVCGCYSGEDDPYLWLHNVICLLVVIFGILPTSVCLLFEAQWRKACRNTVQDVQHLLQEATSLQSVCRKSIRLIQEMELVNRGFTLVTPQAPVTRLEQSGKQPSQRQCPELRHLVFHTTRDAMLQVRTTTRNLINRYLLGGEKGEEGSYLAHVALDEYGPCVLLTDEEDLTNATDNYSIAAVKAMNQLCCLHLSELARRLALQFMLKIPPASPRAVSAFQAAKEAAQKLSSSLSKHGGTVLQIYQLNCCAILDNEEPEVKPSRSKPQSQVSSVYTAVHSLNLHLQAALKRVRDLEMEIEKLRDEGTDDLTPRLQEQITSDLKVIHDDLDACNDCWEEGLCRVEKRFRSRVITASPSGGDKDNKVAPPSAAYPPPIPLFDLEDPIIDDQVFEAYTDPTEVMDLTDWDSERFLSKEEKEKRKQERKEAQRLLKELKTVIVTRGQQWDEREERARQRMAGQTGEDQANPPSEQLGGDHTNKEIESPVSHEDEPEEQITEIKDSKAVLHVELPQDLKLEPTESFPSLIIERVPYVPYTADSISREYDENKLLYMPGKDRSNIYDRPSRPEVAVGLGGEEDGASDVLRREKARLAQLEVLKSKLAQTSSLGFTSNVAAMAAAQSSAFGLKTTDTFGDSDSE